MALIGPERSDASWSWRVAMRGEKPFAPDPCFRAPLETAERVFDPRLGCWVLEPATPEFQVEAPLPSVTPASDGSGVRWTVWDNRTGRPLWMFEAHDFWAALDEKRRLCAGVGGRSGWAHLRPGWPE